MKHLLTFAAVALSTVSFAQMKIELESVFVTGIQGGPPDVEITSVTPQGFALGYCTFGTLSAAPRKAAIFSFDSPKATYVGLKGERSSQALAMSPKGTVIGTSTDAQGRSRFYRLFGDGSVKPIDSPQVTLGLTWLWESEEVAITSTSSYLSKRGYDYYQARSEMSSAGLRFVDDRIEEQWTIPGLQAMHQGKNKGVIKGNITVSNASALRAAQGQVNSDQSCQLDISSPSEFELTYVAPCDASGDGSEIYLRRRRGDVKFNDISITKKGLNAVNVKLARTHSLVHAFKPLGSPLCLVLADAKTGDMSLHYYQGDLKADVLSTENIVPLLDKSGNACLTESAFPISSPDSPVFAYKPKKKSGGTVKASWNLATNKKV